MVGCEFSWVSDAYCLEHPSVQSQDVVSSVSDDFPLGDLPPRL